MPQVKITVLVEVDVRVLGGFPLVRRLEVDESQQFAYEKANDGDAVTFSAMPTDQLAEIQALILQADQAVTLRLDNQSDAGIVVNAGGLVCLVDVDIDAGATTNAKVNNNSGVAANLKGVAGGT